MLNGIELIADERQEQIEDHGRTVENDVKTNSDEQLRRAATRLFTKGETPAPKGWDDRIWRKMHGKTYKERLIIAGALMAAELDRLIFIENKK